MKISALLSPECVRSGVPGVSKKRILELISELAARQLPQVDQRDLFDSLLARERLGSTGIGRGIAIPHGRLCDIELPPEQPCVGVLIQCAQPVDFDAIDRQPVDLLFALFVPEAHCDQHLDTLAAVAERLNDRQICKQLRHAGSDQALYRIITESANMDTADSKTATPATVSATDSPGDSSNSDSTAP